MRSTTRLRALAVVAALAALLAIPATAFAYSPSNDDEVVCVPGEDENVVCEVRSFTVDCEGTYEVIADDGTVLASGTVIDEDGDGLITFEFAQPSGTQDVQVVVDCGQEVLSDTLANVGGDGEGADPAVDVEGESIPNAGSNAGLLALGAAGAIALGAGALFVSRRSRTDTTAPTS